jgi:hypothetical protein
MSVVDDENTGLLERKGTTVQGKEPAQADARTITDCAVILNWKSASRS